MSLRRATATAAALLVLIGGLVVGLGAGSASAGHTDTATGTTAATVPEPVVTTVTQPANPSETLPGANKPPVTVGDLNAPEEQFIIGEIYATALKQEGYSVLLDRNPGTPSARPVALQQGTLDIYPEYIGEWNSTIAHLHHRFRSLRAAFGAAKKYAKRHGFVLLPPTPFSDTSCVAVLSQYAQANHVYSIPELTRSGPIIFGAPTLFQEHGDGLPALERSYHLDPGYLQTIGDGLQYWWLRTGNVDAASCSTTDPSLGSPRYLELRDPKHIFGHGNVIPVTTPHVLKVEGPAFARTIKRVDRLLTLQAVRGLNAEIELGGHSPVDIAEQFLEGNGILPPSRYAPVPTTTSTSPTSTDS
jgi:glycine betaine/choline ABC-type transport system substrate-binding protein